MYSKLLNTLDDGQQFLTGRCVVMFVFRKVLEKNATGCSMPFSICDNWLPMPTLLASVVSQKGCVKSGNFKQQLYCLAITIRLDHAMD